MNEYLLSIIGTVLFSAFLVAILPEGKMSGTIKGVAKMVCLLAIIAPIPQYMQKQKNEEKIENLQEFFSSTGIQTDDAFIKYYSEMRIKETQTQLEREVQDKFSCEAEVTLNTESLQDATQITDIIILSVSVHLPNNESQEKRTQIEEYLLKEYGCKVVFV